MFKSEKKPASPPPTIAEKIAAHQRLAEEHLARSAKAGRLEAETRHATMATAHATLAVSYLLQTSASGRIAPG